MAYIRTEQVSAIRENLKKAFPNLKLSVKKNAHASTVIVTILKGDIDFFGEMVKEKFAQGNNVVATGYMDVNPYWYHEHFTGASLQTLATIEKIIKETAPWFDHSDSQSDYFHTAYYIDMNIGTWEKPYQLTA